MKKIICQILLINSMLMFIACNITPKEPAASTINDTYNTVINVQGGQSAITPKLVEFDSCEWVYTWFGEGNGGGSFVHRGRCKYCAQRTLQNNQLIIDAILKLKTDTICSKSKKMY